MEQFLSVQPLLSTVFEAIIFVLCFIIVVIIGFYNWLYLSRILRSNDQIGLRPPEHVCHLVRTSIFVPFLTALFIIAFFAIELF